MSDINLLIEEAADILTKNERKLQSKKERYTPAELQEMLILQENQKNSNRDALNKKLIAICKKAEKEFNLSSVPVNMMEKVAIDISTQVKEGYITSIENIEKNDMIIKTVQREATKAQIVENYEAEISRNPIPHETIPLYIESIGYIVSNPKVADAIAVINTLSEPEGEINDIVDNINLDNAKDSVEKINQTKKSKEFIEARTNRFKNVAVVIENGDDDEKKYACEDIEREELGVRLFKNPENLDVLVNLYQSFLVGVNSKLANPERIASDMKKTILCNPNLTPEQIVEWKKIIMDYEKTKDANFLMQFLAENIVEINPNVTKEEVLLAAKDAANYELDPERVDKAFLKTQARIRLIDDDEFVQYCDLTEEIYKIENNTENFNWENLEIFHKKTPELYNFALRAMHMKTREMSENQIGQKTDELISDVATERKSEVLLDRTSIREKIDMNSGKNGNKTTFPESFYWTFAAAVNKQPENLQNLKNQMIENVKNTEEISEEEKQNQIQKIERIQTQEDAIEYALDGIENINLENGNDFDRESIREKIKSSSEKNTPLEQAKEIKREQRDEMAARAKIVLTPGEYDRYMETMERLKNPRLKDTVQLDLELVEHLREVDDSLYKWMLEAYTKFANDNRKIEMQNEIQKYRQDIKLEEYKKAKEKPEKSTLQDESERLEEERTQIIEESEIVQEESENTRIVTTDIVVDGENKDEKGKKGILQEEPELENVIPNIVSPTTFIDNENSKLSKNPKSIGEDDEEPDER